MQEIVVKPSAYNILIEKNNSLIIFNTRTGHLMATESSEKDKTVEILSKGKHKYENSSIENFLYTNDFLINDNRNEFLEIVNSYSISENKLYFTLVPTYKCNFMCSYCYVNKSMSTMDESIFDSIYKYIETTVNKMNRDRLILSIIWFGGEPLIEYNKICRFMGRLGKLNANIESNVITNGYLLNSKVFTKLITHGINNFQITFDGDEDFHDLSRKTCSGNNTFKKILANIVDIKDLSLDYNILLRCNLTKTNKQSVLSLAGRLVGDGILNDRIKLTIKPIINFSNRQSEVLFNGYDEVVNYLLAITHEMNGHCNYQIKLLPSPVSKWCYAGQDNSIIFDPNGEIYPCKSFLGNAEYSIGKITRDGKIIYHNNIVKSRFEEIHFCGDEKCISCIALPICMGSCKRIRLFSNHNYCYWNKDNLVKTIIQEY